MGKDVFIMMTVTEKAAYLKGLAEGLDLDDVSAPVRHQAANHTTLASIGAYILVLMFEAMVGRMIMPILISAGLNEAEGIMTITKVFFPALIVTLAFAAIYFFVCKYLMEKHLNLA